MKNYVTYHLHTMDSLLDSCTNYKEYVDKAVELGQTAICFTEHGNIYNWFQKKLYCEEKGIKYLHGIECYLTEKFGDKNIRDNYHTILIAKNKNGFEELNNLFFLASRKDHFYYKPRLSFEEFLNISDNIIKISACVQSPLNRFRKSASERGKNKEDKIILKKLLEHYDYYEIQYHNMPDQIEYNKYLFKMSQKFNKPLIAGTDTHSINAYKNECRTILQYGKTDGAWGEEENECDLTYKDYNELVEAFKAQNSIPMSAVLDAIENTNVMANSVEVIGIDRKNKYPLLYGEKDEEVFKKIINKNYKEKLKNGIITKDPRYVENIKEEMRVFKKIDMVGFMLFMSEIMTWAKENHIATGFARGSVAGSTIAYIANITDVDPIKWNTIFSRFANENRIEAGDIDTDWYEDDRQKVYDYIIGRFGTRKTAYILAVGTLADKSVIDVIGKAFRIKAEKQGKQSVYTLDKIKEIKKEYESNQDATKAKYSDLFYYYDGLCDCVVSQSQHPAGLLVSSIDLIDNCGAFYGSDDQIIVPIDMEECHDMGLIKFDILGLKSVGVIDKTCKMIGKNFPRADEVDWCDKEVFKDIAKDHTSIFQFESDYSGECLKRFKPQSVDDLSLVNACIRPSGETYRDELLARHVHKNPSELLDNLLKDNLGWLVYQEDTIAFLQQICGFSGSEADSIRRAIGKKDVEKIDKALPEILKGYCEKSDKPKEVAEKEAIEFLDVIKSSASYQFGRNHSIAYSMLSYLMGYLRHYYPVEFCTSFLNCAKNDDDIQNGTALAIKRGCKIEDPKFRFSSAEYRCDPKTKTIYKGLETIKYMSTNAAYDLYALKDNKYDTFINLLEDIKKTSVNSKQLDILVKLGYFEEFGNPNELLRQIKIYETHINRKTCDTKSIPNDVAKKMVIRCLPSNYNDYDSFYDFRYNTAEQINNKIIKNAIATGCFSRYGNKRDIALQNNLFDDIYNKKRFTKKRAEEWNVAYCIDFGDKSSINIDSHKELFNMIYANTNVIQEVPSGVLFDYNPIELINNIIEATDKLETSITERIKYQYECLGYVTTVIPSINEDCYFVQDLSGYNNNIATLYNLKNGTLLKIKVRAKGCKKMFVGAIIKVREITLDKRWKKDGDSWIRLDEKEQILTKYSFVD